MQLTKLIEIKAPQYYLDFVRDATASWNPTETTIVDWVRPLIRDIHRLNEQVRKLERRLEGRRQWDERAAFEVDDEIEIDGKNAVVVSVEGRHGMQQAFVANAADGVRYRIVKDYWKSTTTFVTLPAVVQLSELRPEDIKVNDVVQLASGEEVKITKIYYYCDTTLPKMHTFTAYDIGDIDILFEIVALHDNTMAVQRRWTRK
jgi:hypothetical protein